MWPTNPDDFESRVHAAEGRPHEDAWYFLCINGQVATQFTFPAPQILSGYRCYWQVGYLGGSGGLLRFSNCVTTQF